MTENEKHIETKEEKQKNNENNSSKKDEVIICRECHQEGHMSYNCPKIK